MKDLPPLDLDNLSNLFIAHVKEGGNEKIQKLAIHLIEAGELAGIFAAKIGLHDVGYTLGLLHDFGKYSLEFQAYIKSGTGLIEQDEEEWIDSSLLKGKIDHSTAGAQYIFEKLRGIGSAGQGELCGQILALCIASHHSGLIDCLDTDKNAVFDKRMHKDNAKTHIQECIANVDVGVKKLADNLLDEKLVREMLQVILKIVKQPKLNEIFSLEEAFTLGTFTRFLFSCLIDADRINSAEFELPERKQIRQGQLEYFNWDIAIERLNNKLNNFEIKHPIDDIRKSISDTCYQRSFDKQGIYSLTVPTGGGKTLASLRYALHHAKLHQLDRIIYVIPYTSIIEQNAQAVRKIVERDDDAFSWVLEHHSNIEPDKQTWRSKLVAENWDAPIVFTTMVQFLETLFSGGTKSVRRMHQLAKSVLIFDEIQTLPINCVHMFCHSLNFLSEHANTTAVLCTATQPTLNSLYNPKYGSLRLAKNAEIVHDTAQLFDDLKRIDVVNRCKAGGWSKAEIFDWVQQRFAQTKSCLVIVNTKTWAKDIFVACQQFVHKGELFHLSTHQCPAHRKALLSEIRLRLKDKKPVLCISTQLIEAGVDISFAHVVRFLAGLDSIAQAGGRCNRSGELENELGQPVRGTLDVINPTEESITNLVDIKEGQTCTKRLFQDIDIGDILSPMAMKLYFKYFFFERHKEMVFPIKNSNDSLLNVLANNDNNNGKLINESRRKRNKLPLLQQSFMTAGKVFKAIDAPTKSIIVPYNAEAKALITTLCGTHKTFNASKFYESLKKAQQYSVNVFPNVWANLQESEAVREVQVGQGIYYLDESYYNNAFGLSTDRVGDLAVNIC